MTTLDALAIGIVIGAVCGFIFGTVATLRELKRQQDSEEW